MSVCDPLVCTYKALQQAIHHVHGQNFEVRDDTPNPIDFKKVLPAANISYVSGTYEKGLMREYEPWAILKNPDGTFTVGTESARFNYLIQVSFFADKPGKAQRLSTEFMSFIEIENELPISGDKWGEVMEIFLATPPLPPRGQPDLYQVDATYQCTGRLITEQIVNAVDVSKFKPKVG
ncbi:MULTISPECIES: hypothetical protein [Brevibacillus]|uniref:hypothetical protein n=1 Tax=Brevibacillus TaxID=55080 RepID=UPI0004F2513C|nr:hypothetical protein [Brevibacillus borstelensis]KKX52566.1 hypothetical protein X546_24465 [Brevibacillus borstelensis cifa_chp40]